MSRSTDIGEVYKRRRTLHPRGYYSLFDPGHLYLMQRRERELLKQIGALDIKHLSELRLLDVGCSTGQWLQRFLADGVRDDRAFGIELQHALLRDAAVYRPGLHLANADAAALPFADATFDLVHQATLMTLVPDPAVRQRIAQEMLRVVRPDGAILWFDMRYSNPKNPDIRGIGSKELRSLFPGCSIKMKSLSLVPMLTRRIASWSFTAARVLELVPPLRIHYLATILPPGAKG